MSSKKRKGKGKKKGNTAYSQMLEALKKEIDGMHKTIKKQNKRISGLELDNKRFKKTLQKIQMNGASESSNHLISPNSMTSDIEPSDNEESKDESKKSKAQTTAPSKPKVVLRRNRPKPKKKASDIRFTFDMAHQKIKAAENGSCAVKPKVYGGTIRFGRFLNFSKNNADNIASYRILFDTRSIGQNSSLAIGFATTSFGGWVGSNFGQNNSCLIKGNSQFLTTDKIFKCKEGKEYKHKQMTEILKKADNPKHGFFKDGDDVTVEMDLKNCIGKIWNESDNKDGQDDSKVFEIILPNEYDVAIVVYMGGSAKKRLIVKDQKFVFDEESEIA
eukprot:26658_1